MISNLEEHSLRVLITSESLDETGGAAAYVRDFSLEILRQGHRPIAYSTRVGRLAEELRRGTVPVAERLDQVGSAPDLIFGNGPVETVAALLQFPATPVVMVCHSWEGTELPRMERIVLYLAVDETCQDRLTCHEGIPEERTRVHYNPVDLSRFTARSPLPERPARALIYSNYAREDNYVPLVREACAEANITLEVMGEGTGTGQEEPERWLADYDLVFAKGRCALEALAVGAAVVLCDATGMGEMVTTERMALLRRQNFGRRAMCYPITAERLSSEIARYDAADATEVSARIRREEGLPGRAQSLIAIFREAIGLGLKLPPGGRRMEQRGVARFLETIAPRASVFALNKQFKEGERHLREAMQGMLAATMPMEAVTPEERAGVELQQAGAPAQVRAGKRFNATVQLANGGARLLSSYPPYPVLFSFRWLLRDGTVSVFEGERSKVFPPLPPGRSHEYPVAVTAPDEPGHYLLRLTLVQEGVAWWDDATFADVPVEVCATGPPG